jgi:hypothetical protein
MASRFVVECLRLVVGHARAGLVIDVEELVLHDCGNAGYRYLDEILVQHLDPELPARRELLEVACAGGNKLFVGIFRFEAQLEPVSGELLLRSPRSTGIARDNTDKQPSTSVISNVKELQESDMTFIEKHNNAPAPYILAKSATDISRI